MNLPLILFYGQKAVLDALDTVTKDLLETKGACGVWSVKDILAHLASYEHVLNEVVGQIENPTFPTPTLDQMNKDYKKFNAEQTKMRKNTSYREILTEYEQTHEQMMKKVKRTPPRKLSKPGTLPWYGSEYALDDYLLYTAFGHKHEHAAQIAAFISSSEINAKARSAI